MLSLVRNEAVPLETMRQGMPWDWVTFREYLDSVERTPKGVNVMSFVPLAPLYGYVVGTDEAKKRPATDEELQQMCDLLDRRHGSRRLRHQRANSRQSRAMSSSTMTARPW